MSLLPKNSSLRDQRFASFLDDRNRCNYSDLDTNPLTCDSSLLPHIALIKGVNIENMTDRYIKIFEELI